MSLLVMLTEMNAKIDTLVQKDAKDNTTILDAIANLRKEIVGENTEQPTK